MSGGLYNTHKADFDTTLDLTRLKAYGDTMNDGKVQFSFTLPVKNDEKGMEAARQLVRKGPVKNPTLRLQSLWTRSSHSMSFTAALCIPLTMKTSMCRPLKRKP